MIRLLVTIRRARRLAVCAAIVASMCSSGGAGHDVLPASMADAPLHASRNLFAELAGADEAALDAKIAVAWDHFFAGDPDRQRLYFAGTDGTACIRDVGSGDVRSEGMSYGMMIAVQLGRKAEFDALWTWAKKHMYHADGPRRGYFAWQCSFDGRQIDPGSASDGEEWIATTLFFASHRWGDGEGIYNYGAEARALLGAMLDGDRGGQVTAIFDSAEKQVVFAPSRAGSVFTDPSYHLPAFYELWARWDDDPARQAFWKEAAATSRTFFHRAANPDTGLMPEYANFDGSPFLGFGAARGDFRFDAWRTPANVALDHAWWAADSWQVGQSNRLLRFLGRWGEVCPNQFTLDGRPLSADTSTGQIAMAAVAGLAADPALARPFVERLWHAPVPQGQWRYYDGLLYFLGLLEVGGRFQVIEPGDA